MKEELEPSSLIPFPPPPVFAYFCHKSLMPPFRPCPIQGLVMSEDGWALEGYVEFIRITSMVSSYYKMQYTYPQINFILNGDNQPR